MVAPAMSIDVASAGTVTLPAAPTAVMRLFVTTMSPRAMTSSPFIVMIRALRSTMVPRGMSRVACTSTRFSAGS